MNIAKQMVGLVLLLVGLAVPQSVGAEEEVNPWSDFAVTAVVSGSAPTPVATRVNRQPALARTTSSMPAPRTHYAPTNMALKAVGRNYLPPTRLTSFIAESGEAEDIYGHEGDVKNEKYSPIASGFDLGTQEGLTTGHQSDAPSGWAYDTWNKPQD